MAYATEILKKVKKFVMENGRTYVTYQALLGILLTVIVLFGSFFVWHERHMVREIELRFDAIEARLPAP